MSSLIVKLLLLIIFCTGCYFVFEFGAGGVTTSNGFTRPGYAGGAIGAGLVAAAALFGYIYYEVHGPGKKGKSF